MATRTKRNPAASAYANALLEVGQARGEGDAYADQLGAVAAAIDADAELRVFLESPKIARKDKKAALERALAGKVAEPVLNLLRVLVDRGRQGILGDVAATYGDALDIARGRVHVQITAAQPVSASSRDRILALLRERLRKEIISEERTDPALLGGVTVRIGDTVIDGSLRTQLKAVRDAMAAPRLGRKLIG